MLPQRLIRTVPADTSDEVETLWQIARVLHPEWDMVTFRDPIDPAEFPLTSWCWDACESGAQLAGLIRLEALWHLGGIYIDSDVQVVKSFEGLRPFDCFAAWEDANTVPDAVLGATDHHPAIFHCIVAATERLTTGGDDWQTGRHSWSTGPGVTTTVLAARDDVTLLSPRAFYPVHYSRKADLDGFEPGPETYAIHRWAASWLPEGATP